MPRKLVNISERIFNTPLLIHPGKASVILGVLQDRLPQAIEIDESFSFSEDELEALADSGAHSTDQVYARTAEGVAIVPVVGTLVNRGAWIGANSGMVSYEGIRHQLNAAAADPKVKSILLDIQSPGGEAIGTAEIGQVISKLSESKPITTIANGMAASAAYWMGSQSNKIVNTRSGVLGGIGVVYMHTDVSAAMEQEGMKATFIYAGAHKVDGNPFGPLPDTVKADIQEEVDTMYKDFVWSVAKGRGISPQAVRDTEARTYIGSKAVDVGLADSVGSFDSVLAEMTRAASKTISTPPSRKKANTRNSKMEQDEIMFTQEQMDKAVAEAEARGAQAQIDRLRLIVDEDSIEGQEAVAIDLALRSPGMDACDVVDFVAALPKVEKAPSLLDRARFDPGASAAEAPSPQASWGKTISSLNSRRGFKS